MSSPVVSGSATAVVVKTGMSTEYGKIAERLTARPPETEFERGLKQFSYLITRIIFLLVIFVFFTNALFKHGVLDSLLFAVALAVGLTPELLPMILTVNHVKGCPRDVRERGDRQAPGIHPELREHGHALHRQDRDPDREPDHADLSCGCGEEHK